MVLGCRDGCHRSSIEATGSRELGVVLVDEARLGELGSDVTQRALMPLSEIAGAYQIGVDLTQLGDQSHGELAHREVICEAPWLALD